MVLFNQRRNAIGNRLHDPFLIHRNLSTFKAQGVAAMTGSLNGRFHRHARAIFHVRILDHRNSAEPRHGHGQHGRIVLQAEQVAAVTGGAGRDFIRIKWLDVAHGSAQRDLPQVKECGSAKISCTVTVSSAEARE